MVSHAHTYHFNVQSAHAIRYYFERAEYTKARYFGEAAYTACGFSIMMPKSILASVYRTVAAIALEIGMTKAADSYVQEYLLLYTNVFPKSKCTAKKTWQHGDPTEEWSQYDNAICASGLLDRAPDAVGHSPWGFDEVEGFPSLIPFLSLSYYGWLHYANGRLEEAARCFLQLLGAHRSSLGHDNCESSR